jgi:N-acetylneuraminic acid mutarotase
VKSAERVKIAQLVNAHLRAKADATLLDATLSGSAMSTERERIAIEKALDAMMSADAGEASWATAIAIMSQHYLVAPQRMAWAIYNTLSPKRNGQLERAVYAAIDVMGPVGRMTLSRYLEDIVEGDGAAKAYAKMIARIRPDQAEFDREYAAGRVALHAAVEAK